MLRSARTGIRQIDLATVLTISRAIGSEVDPERLGARLAALAIDHAGATRARFVSPVEADAELPPAILESIRRTRAPILPDDRPAPSMWIPVRDGDVLLGVLCLEGVQPAMDQRAAIAELIGAIASVGLTHARRDIGHHPTGRSSRKRSA